MTDSSRFRFSVAKEAGGFGLPVSTPVMKVVRAARFDLTDQLQYLQSDNIRPDRNTADMARVGRDVSGTLSFDLHSNRNGGAGPGPVTDGLTDMLEAAMCSSFGTVHFSTGVALTNGQKIITGVSSAGANYEVGDIIRVDRGLVAANNGYCRVVAVDNGTSTLFVERENNFVTDAGPVIVQRGGRCKNGIVKTSFLAEAAYLAAPLYQVFRGVTVDTMSIEVADRSLTRCSFGLRGKLSELAAVAGSTYPEPVDSPVFDSVGVPVVYLGGVPPLYTGGVPHPVKSIGLNVANNVDPSTLVGTEGATSMSLGRADISGSLTAYLDDWNTMTKYVASSDVALWWAIQDSLKYGYTFSLPRVRLTNQSHPVEGANSRVMRRIDWRALGSTTEGCALRLQQFTSDL